MSGQNIEKRNPDGERIWVEPSTEEEWEEVGSTSSGHTANRYGEIHTGPNRSQNNEPNRVFSWRDPSMGVDVSITAFPDKLIPGLYCPDCSYPACQTDQVGVALCTGTPGWYFYYREFTDGFGKPKTKYKIVNGQQQEVTEYEITKIERQPDGNFKEKKEED